MYLNRKFVLDSRPADKVAPGNFRLVEESLPAPEKGQVVVRHHYLSLDPYMRGRMSEAKSYAAPQPLGETMIGGTVGEVVASENSRFAPGDFVVGAGGWQLYASGDGRGLKKIDAKSVSPQAYLGPLGMPGVTAWWGLNKIIAPKAGETVLVTAATGAVGSIVGQLAKIAGAHAIGVAGGAEKCAYATKELGYDVCVDHKSARFAEALKAAAAQGLDGVFENVGGEPFLQALRRLNDFARIAVCGLIASYEGPTDAAARHASLPGSTHQGRGLHRLRPPRRLAAGDRRTRRPRRRRPAALARNGAAGVGKRAAGAHRPAARRQFRQDADQAYLVSLNTCTQIHLHSMV